MIGGGPAGLMAAEAALAGGAEVDLYEAMPSVGRKLLLAGKGGLNLTHAEPREAFLHRYGPHRTSLAPWLEAFDRDAIRAWARSLGVETFVGTSGRVFPTDLKSAPLLRAWLRRLRHAGLRIHVRHRWIGWDRDGALRVTSPSGEHRITADAAVLALGGASWPQFGSDASWVPLLEARGVPLTPLRPSNCGFDVRWSEYFRAKWAGHPVKSVRLAAVDGDGVLRSQGGDCLITDYGLEGGPVYGLSRWLRERIAQEGSATLHLDLAPDRSLDRLTHALARPRGHRTIATHLARQTGLTGVKAGLLREVLGKEELTVPARVAAVIKSLPIRLLSPRPIAEAISTAGGVSFDGLDDRLMLRAVPGVFCAGEMLDWDAPTGGYLLTACLATGRGAGEGAVAWAREHRSGHARSGRCLPEDPTPDA